MSKIQKIFIQDFKAIDSLEINFKGCTGIITGGNNKGKTSFLRGIPDRIRFVRPEVMVKKGSTKGKGEMTLDTGERFVWEFTTDGTDKLTYFTTEGAKRNVTVELGQKFFPKPFDVDKFLNSTPKEQSKQLQKILGIDFTDIDSRYAEAYQLRTDKNKDAEKFHVKLTEMMECPKVDFVDMSKLQQQKETERSRLNTEYIKNKKANDDARSGWNAECSRQTTSVNSENNRLLTEWTNSKMKINEEVAKHNEAEKEKQETITAVSAALATLSFHGYGGGEVANWLDKLRGDLKPIKNAADHYPPEPKYSVATMPKEPTYIPEMPDDKELKYIDDLILTASQTNQQAQDYKNYTDYKKSVELAKSEAEAADAQVKAIEAERLQMIQSAPFPEGIAITPDGITVDGLPLDRNQLSSSRITIAALQIASINLGEVKTLFFDASYLDRNSLNDVNTWATKNDFQLLIEKPDWDGGEIKYELIEGSPIAAANKELFNEAA